LQSIFRLVYSLAVAILFILFVIFGTRMLFEEPEEFQFPDEADREEYFRNVFVSSGILGVAAIAAGVVLYKRIDALPLGMLLGGIGAILYGWVEWSRGPDEAGNSVVFIVVTVGLALVLAGGYYFLSDREAGKPAAPKSG